MSHFPILKGPAHFRKCPCTTSRHVSRGKGLSPSEYLSVQQLAARIGYRPQTIRNLMVRGIFELDVHYFKPFGRPLFKWSSVVDLIEGARRGEARRV